MSDKKYTSINHEKAAGRVEFRSGKAVWEWSGGGDGESTSILLKRLENPELELERTRKMAVARQGSAPDKPTAGVSARAKSKPGSPELFDFTTDIRAGLGQSGFDPYNNG